jgi:hypothetical protein
MKEKFEHKLTNRINEVFNSHNPEFNAQDWEKMKTMLDNKRLPFKLYLIRYMKVAAVLLLLAIGGYFLWEMNGNSLPEKEEKVEMIAYPDNQPKVEDQVQQNLAQEDFSKPGNENHSDQTATEDRFPIEHTHETVPPNKQGDLTETQSSPADQIVLQLPEIKQTPETIQIIPSDLFADFDPEIEIRFRPDELYLAQFDDSSNFKGGSEDGQNSPEIYSSESTKTRTSMGVEVASFTQYSPDDLNPGLGVGAGFAANIPIFKGLAFAPGLTVNRQNLAYDNQNTLEQEATFTMTDNNELKEYLSNNPEVSPTDVSLTTLDLPLNLQYRFIEGKKTNYFLELGISSLLYLSEDYTYEFTNNVSGGYDVGAFQTFDFASLLNFSVGIDFQLGKRFDMVFNPYLKYPVSDLSDADLRFGNGGIKMKFMIFPKK